MTSIPLLQISPEWNEKEKFWVNYEYKDKKIDTEYNPNLKNENFSFQFHDGKVLVQGLDLKINFLAPIANLKDIHKNSIENIDISPDGSLGLTSSESILRIWETKQGIIQRDCKGHIGDIYDCGFLPSGEVLISCASDCTTKLWRLKDSLCIATFKGHEQAVVSYSLIERGRNFVTCSKDGTLKLWDCASQSCITTLLKKKQRLNNTSVYKIPDVKEEKKPLDNKEYMTFGKLAAVVSEDGCLSIVDIASRDEIVKDLKLSSSPLSCCSIDGDKITVGSENGEIHILDIKKPKETLESYQRSKVPITRVLNNWVSCKDGSIFHFNNGKVDMELSGPNFDPIYDIQFYDNFIYSVSRDSVIRKYFIGDK